MLIFIINNQLFFIIVVSIIFGILAIRIYRYENKNDIEIDDGVNILGFGRADGVYLIKVGGFYLVAGIKLKSKKKAIKKFIEIVEKNGYIPPESYFKMIKVKTLK